MKKMYIVKFKETKKQDYLYHIAFCNLVGKGVTYSTICTTHRVLAMRFQKKYVAETIAKLTLGEVEVVGDIEGIELAERSHFMAFDYGVDGQPDYPHSGEEKE